MVSGSISLPCSGFFSPFPHGTGSLSLTRLYLALADGPACFRQDSSCLAVLRIPLGFNQISNTGLAPSSAGLSIPFFYPLSCHIMVLQPRSLDRFGLLPFRSPLLRESLLFSFPPAYLDVSVRRVPLLQAMYSPADDSSCLLPGSPIRTPPLLRFLTASRSFSQFGASFFSFEWPGIRRTPFLT